jgi:hypothetical protein
MLFSFVILFFVYLVFFVHVFLIILYQNLFSSLLVSNFLLAVIKQFNKLPYIIIIIIIIIVIIIIVVVTIIICTGGIESKIVVALRSLSYCSK